ncbi:hypothetical protein Celaphus_00014259 [Cervus elaphus hippelaphus]|uniref:FYVE-type domain-containing protein n=1 Tax=Cervus elaphus hippelaphus TaxID=46360 RepID=A0A212D4M4_CEREH|nr:hypothetical protein Celaphus_00014259 [Cervus elaphus hippelaphus]
MIFSAAQHSNAAITEMERLQELWEVYQRLGLEDDIVDPSNTLLREGPVLKISFRRNGPMERYLFLFNNMLLYCVPRVIQVGAHFQVRTRIDVAGMKVRELADAEFPHSFLSVELGLRAPQWVRDKMVTMCMRCQEPFNALTRRRHHCRACGYVVCARCSDYRAELKYDANRPNRVCLDCYTFLTGNVLPEEKEDKRRGILEKGAVAGSEQSLICSFLQLLGDKWGKSGSRGWCAIPRDDPLVLYVYAAPQGKIKEGLKEDSPALPSSLGGYLICHRLGLLGISARTQRLCAPLRDPVAPVATRKCKLEVPGWNGVTHYSMNECEDVEMCCDQEVGESWELGELSPTRKLGTPRLIS